MNSDTTTELAELRTDVASLHNSIAALHTDLAELQAELQPIIELFANLQRTLAAGAPGGPLAMLKLLQG